MTQPRLALSLGLSACLALAACGGKGDVSEAQAEAPTAQPPAASNIGTDPSIANAAADPAAAPTASNVGASDGTAQAAYNAANPPTTPTTP